MLNTHRRLPSRFILILVLLIIIFLLVFLQFFKPKEGVVEQPNFPTYPNSEGGESSSVFKLISIKPEPPFIKSVWSVEPFTLTFSQPFKVDTVSYTTNPETRTKTQFFMDDPNSFSIIPLDGWDEYQPYTIIISPNLESISGNKLAEEAAFGFTRLPPTEEEINHPPNLGI